MEFKTRDTSRRQYRNNPYPRQPYSTHYNNGIGIQRNVNTYQSSSYISGSSGSSTSYHYHQQHSNRFNNNNRETGPPTKVPKNQRSLPSKEIPQPSPKINEEEVQKNAIRYGKFELNIKERLDSFKEKKKDGPIICHREMKEITKGFDIRFDEWSSFVAAAPKIPPRPKEKNPQPNNNRFSPYNKASSSLSQQKQNCRGKRETKGDNKESQRIFKEERKGKMSPEIEVITYRSKKAPEIAAKRPAQMAPIVKSPDATTRDSSKIKFDSNNDLTTTTSSTSISTVPTISTKKVFDKSIQYLEGKDNEMLVQHQISTQTDDYKPESRSVHVQTDNTDVVPIDPEEVLFYQTVAERKFKLAKTYKRRADHSRPEKELSGMTEKQKLERLSDHMEILILYIEWFYRNIQAHGENTIDKIDKIGTVLNSIDNHFGWVSDNAKKHDPLALLPLINKLRAIFLMNRLGLEQKRFTKLSNEYIKSFNEEAKTGIFSNTIPNKYINTLNEMQKSATNLFKLITNLWDEGKDFHVSNRVNNGVNPLNLTMPIEKASEFARMFVSDWRNINNIDFVSLS
ncbi:10807_t:CDS:2 [Entrophospora sp. SA101]|nr:10807_t:CDS:2 [Entrophospora sp. SA101]